jgi:hypothetical protein
VAVGAVTSPPGAKLDGAAQTVSVQCPKPPGLKGVQASHVAHPWWPGPPFPRVQLRGYYWLRLQVVFGDGELDLSNHAVLCKHAHCGRLSLNLTIFTHAVQSLEHEQQSQL